MSDGAGKYERLIESAIENLSRHFFDSYEESNAKFRTETGLKMIVVREEIGDCCSWCADLAGVYDYDSAPKEVWARHANCRCMVITRTEKGTWQDAWSRKEYQSEREARISRGEEIYSEATKRIIETGGKKYEPYDKNNKKDIAAAKEYRRISRHNDIDAVARASGLSPEDVKEIKRHIFYEKHELYEGYRQFVPDYDMAVAWKRLENGVPEDRDIVLLKHELLESRLERRYNLPISKAHRIANAKYNWEKRLFDEMGAEGEPYGLL